MSKEKDIEILQHKIADIEARIANHEKYNIADKKIGSLKILKLKYEDELAELQLASMQNGSIIYRFLIYTHEQILFADHTHLQKPCKYNMIHNLNYIH